MFSALASRRSASLAKLVMGETRSYHPIHVLMESIYLFLTQICELFGKGLKQQKTTVLLGLLSLIAFSLGHATVQVHDFWSEPIILWMAIVLPTGNFFFT